MVLHWSRSRKWMLPWRKSPPAVLDCHSCTIGLQAEFKESCADLLLGLMPQTEHRPSLRLEQKQLPRAQGSWLYLDPIMNPTTLEALEML